MHDITNVLKKFIGGNRAFDLLPGQTGYKLEMPVFNIDYSSGEPALKPKLNTDGTQEIDSLDGINGVSLANFREQLQAAQMQALAAYDDASEGLLLLDKLAEALAAKKVADAPKRPT